ncbi:tRNA pseudouridine synthase A [Candidatus Portiera aleyrodidarum]|uniref:tRNA pseudouridine synthase A n=1 Tax=Candidatus Portiera aleyrodidarum TaxID=91844 RepID=A0A6S6RVL8_9GAMM|nr:tRNA pseudouridine(38-40) synthase TruA [Candidatus Portiera aleyrodidarum]CAA3704286.1 tRNA pseudouridine synthase A [Candidatus Portiera aleyrodidarum]
MNFFYNLNFIYGRIVLGVEYIGFEYFGWQRLKQYNTIQQTLEEALKIFTGHAITLKASSRTDSGVHAIRQIAQFDSFICRSQKSWVLGLNSNLPSDVRIRWAVKISDKFNSRKAIARRYKYLIYNKFIDSALIRNTMSCHKTPLNIKQMHIAAQSLVGKHDFLSYCSSNCKSISSIKTLHFVEVRSYGPIIIIDIQANSFLHNMVRNIVGALLEIGNGRHSVNWCKKILFKKNRNEAGKTAKAKGLYLVDVLFNKEFQTQLPHEPNSIIGPHQLFYF